MKRIALFLLLLICCVAAWLYYPSSQPKFFTNQTSANNTLKTGSSVQHDTNAPQPTVTNTDNYIVPAGVDPDYFKLFREETAKDPNFEWKRPINFWGRVLDENEKPVTDAQIKFVWSVVSTKVLWNGVEETQATSDSNGYFSLLNRTGKGLSVHVLKEGYYKFQADGSYEYANPYNGLFVPDPNNPVVFHLRKKGEAEPMIHRRKLFGAQVEGTPQYIDLVEGKNKKTPSGDLMLRFVRGAKSENQSYDWTVTLAAPGGGLVESTNEFMLLAPENGYEGTFELSHKAGAEGWVSQEKRKFYVRSRDGKTFSRIEITFIPEYNDHAAIDIDYFLNPSGSRNLEYDEAKDITGQYGGL